MFCPKCATQNVDGASYCRACGANISLVPQALTGQLPTTPADDPWSTRRGRRQQRRDEASLERAIKGLMLGIAFAVIAVLVGRFSPGGQTWWFWLLIPSMAMFGTGFAQLIKLNQGKRRENIEPPQLPRREQMGDLGAPRTGELMPPVPSVTEGTTRHLGSDASTQHLDSLPNQKSS